MSADPDNLWRELGALIPSHAMEALDPAFRLAASIHEGQQRKAAPAEKPSPYIVHPLRVAHVLAAEWNETDVRALRVCLLHDALEDCLPGQQQQVADEIDRVAGREATDAIWVLTKPMLPDVCPPEIKGARDARYFAVLRKAEHWVRLIKCADRVDNLRDAKHWGNGPFWTRYSSETIGWHLYLAHETSPITEVALFKALVEGERTIRGEVPVWADGFLIDRTAAAKIPEDMARKYNAIGLSLRGHTLSMGMLDPEDSAAIQAIEEATGLYSDPIKVSASAIKDAFMAQLYGEPRLQQTG